jgi:hypothetical protein
MEEPGEHVPARRRDDDDRAPPAARGAWARGEVDAKAVETALDLDILAASQAQEQQERRQVQEKLDEVNEVLREAFGLR